MTTRRVDVSGPGFSDDDSPPASNLSSMQRAIVTIQKMRAKIESLERTRNEAIAIVGMACRFPGGANTPEAFFKLLEDGIDTVSEVPPERWIVEPEGPNSDGDARALRWGSFLKDIDRFDATFFGISPREAESLDPQHRLLLEVTWEALERAGQLPEKVFGSKSGVFVGIWAPDYQQRVLSRPSDDLDAYCFTGTLLSTAAGRLSYTLGIQGPCMSIDTACSSSLTAIHLACQSLRSGESNMAIAGGVNLMLVPTTTKLLSKTQALSPDGRCKTFDARANGYVRGEGCGMLVLKRLSDAERDGDAVLALIRGSAVNQDGRSTGLTAPNVLSQQALLRQALESARLSPQDIAYLETHGTGTSLGDPIEVEAIKAVLGAPRERGATCVLGALKSNIGHLEAAAGVAGVIKAVLAMQHEKIPGNLHFRSLNPRIDLGGTALEIAQAAKPWASGIRPRYAGISSFGISGTNAHVILEEAPRNLEEALLEEESSTLLLPISAKTPDALRAHAKAFREMLAGEPSARLLDIVHTASARRSHYVHRLSVVGQTKEEMVQQLDHYLLDDTPPGVSEGKSTPARAKVVFVFSGQGSQWLGMGRQLYETDASFRSVIDTCDNLMTSRLGWSLLDEFDAPEGMSRISETQVAQPLIFALQVALVEMLRSWGISPDAMIGHSVGEIAAAHIAGILSLDEAIRLVAIRGRIMQKATGMGKMVSVSMTAEDAQSILAGYEDRVSIAAINDPNSIVLSGATSALEDVIVRCEKRGFATRPLRVDYAFHSPQMDVFERELVERLGRVDTRRATLAMYSTVLAECVEGKELDVRYWGRNVRQAVEFAGAVNAAIRDGYQLFLEVGPHPVLSGNIQQCLLAKKADGAVNHTMRRNQDQRRTLLEAVGTLYTRGCSPEWPRLVPGGSKSVALPTYPWQRERYWVELPQTALAHAEGQSESNLTKRAALDHLIQTIEWRKLESRPSPQVNARGEWLVFADSTGAADAIMRQLGVRGETVIRVDSGAAYFRHDSRHFQINPENVGEHERLLREAFDRTVHCKGILYLFALNSISWENNGPELGNTDISHAFSSAVNLIQAMLRHVWRDKPKLWLCTRGAQLVGATQISVEPIHGLLWGLGRTLALEQPEIPSALVDLSAEDTQACTAAFVEELLADEPEENQIAFRKDGRYVARLVPSKVEAAPMRKFCIESEGTYLVTGGFGGLGLGVAQWLVKNGARHIALMGRSLPNKSAQNVVRQLEHEGATILAIQGDVSHEDDVNAAIRTIDDSGHALRGIIHAAGAIGPKQPLAMMSHEASLFVFSSKLQGAINLFRTLGNKRLDFFIFYSSASAMLGLVGHAPYAAANAFLDALATYGTKASMPTMSIQWGAFADVGIAGREGRGERMAAAGVGALDVEAGMRALDVLLTRPRPTVGIFSFDLRQWLEVFPQATASRFWFEMPIAEKNVAAKGAADAVRWQDELGNVSQTNRRSVLDKLVREELGRTFRMEPSRIDATAAFSTIGVDSLMSLEVKNRIERCTGLHLPATLLFTYATLNALVVYLDDQLGSTLEETPAARTQTTDISTDSSAYSEDLSADDLLADFDATMNLVREKQP